VASKVDLLARELVYPTTSPWWHPILLLAAGAAAFAIIYFTGLYLLPKLTPNSAVAIGLANKRTQQYRNVFKLLVFTVFLSGVIVPLALKILGVL